MSEQTFVLSMSDRRRMLLPVTKVATKRSDERGGAMSGKRALGRSSRGGGSGIAVGPVAWAVMCTLLVVAVGVLPPVAEWSPARNVGSTASVRVANADTLWSVARAHRLPGRTIAETVEEIRRVNGLTSSGLEAGTTLAVPSPTGGGTAYAQLP